MAHSVRPDTRTPLAAPIARVNGYSPRTVHPGSGPNPHNVRQPVNRLAPRTRNRKPTGPLTRGVRQNLTDRIQEG